MRLVCRDNLHFIRVVVRMSIIIIAMHLALPVLGQTGWQTCGIGTCVTSGNVGIGTTDTIRDFTGTGTTVLTIKGSTASSQIELATGQVAADNVFIGAVNWADASSSYVEKRRAVVGSRLEGVSAGQLGANIVFFTAAESQPVYSERMRITGLGNIGIGTASPTHKLAVNGTIRAKEVIVDNGWADYVFRPDYRLRSLSEVSTYLLEHHRLPEMPSESEVHEKGVSLGEMQAKLLAKIEELTLYLIQIDAQNKRLERQNQDLQDRLALLEARGRTVSPTTVDPSLR